MNSALSFGRLLGISAQSCGVLPRKTPKKFRGFPENRGPKPALLSALVLIFGGCSGGTQSPQAARALGADPNIPRPISTSTGAGGATHSAAAPSSPPSTDGPAPLPPDPVVPRVMADFPKTGPIRGTVLHNGKPALGQSVSLLSSGAPGAKALLKTATTDEEGHFTLPVDAPTYDLVIVSPSKASVSIYRGLTRRNPVLTHKVDPQPTPHHRASIAGTFTLPGGQRLSEDALHVQFGSAYAHVDEMRGGPNGPHPVAPNYGPISVEWDGPRTIQGKLAAYQSSEANGETTDWFGEKSVTLTDGDSAAVQLAMAPLDRGWQQPVCVLKDGRPFLPDSILVRYHDLSSGLEFSGDRGNNAKPFRSPDFATHGFFRCVSASKWNPYLRSSTTLCNVKPGVIPVLKMREAPSITQPPPGTPGTVGMAFEWSSIPESTYIFELVDSTGVSAERPRIHVYTSENHTIWPDLTAYGVAFPKPTSQYRATVTARGAFSGMDEFAGTDDRIERWVTDSPTKTVNILPPQPKAAKGKGEAPCYFPYGTRLNCNQGAGAEHPEFYMLAAINHRLLYFPEFAKAAGLQCVRDCAGARKFTAAYRKYSRLHPNFERDMPLDTEQKEPPLPRQIQEMEDELAQRTNPACASVIGQQ